MMLTENEKRLLNVMQGRKPDDTPKKLRITQHQWEFIQKMKAEGRMNTYIQEVDFK